jgi:NarL family two-component system response regulator LiaR
MALAELERLLALEGLPAECVRLETALISQPGGLSLPAAGVYLIEAFEKGRAAELIAREILAEDPDARVLIVLEKCEEATAFPLLRLGVKGLLCYSDLSAHLGRAVRELSHGGFWVTRTILSGFVSSTLSARRPRLVSASANLSRREGEVHDLLMQNMSNKEIAKRLQMGERTVKFHVSNLLGKHGVKRRADLILLSMAEKRRAQSA